VLVGQQRHARRRQGVVARQRRGEAGLAAGDLVERTHRCRNARIHRRPETGIGQIGRDQLQLGVEVRWAGRAAHFERVAADREIEIAGMALAEPHGVLEVVLAQPAFAQQRRAEARGRQIPGRQLLLAGAEADADLHPILGVLARLEVEPHAVGEGDPRRADVRQILAADHLAGRAEAVVGPGVALMGGGRRWSRSRLGHAPGLHHLRLLLRLGADQHDLGGRRLGPDPVEFGVDLVFAERGEGQAADPLVFFGGGEGAVLGQVGDDRLRQLGAGHGRRLADLGFDLGHKALHPGLVLVVGQAVARQPAHLARDRRFRRAPVLVAQ